MLYKIGLSENRTSLQLNQCWPNLQLTIDDRVWTRTRLADTLGEAEPYPQLFKEHESENSLRRQTDERRDVSLEEADGTRLTEEDSNAMTNALVFVGRGVH